MEKDRMTELETEMERLQQHLQAGSTLTGEQRQGLQREIDRIECEINSLQDNFVPQSSDVDANEL